MAFLHGAEVKYISISQNHLISEIQRARRDTFALVEALAGHQPNWPAIRGQLLRIFGREGLEVLLAGMDSTNGTGNGQDTVFADYHRKS